MIRLLPRRKPLPPGDPWDPSRPLLEWTPGVPWTIADSYMGVCVFGSTGSGKTSGSMAAVSLAMLRAGFGALYLTVKPEDRQTYTDHVRAAGRLDDLMIFSPDHLLRYNFIQDEIDHAESTTGLIENLNSLIMTTTELAERGGGSSSGGDNDRYFRLESSRLGRNSLTVLVFSGEPVTIPNLHRLIVSAPRSMEQIQSGEWRNTYCGECLEKADQVDKLPSQAADFDLALSYFLREWPALSSRTRSVVQSTLTSSTDMLSRGAARDMLSSPNPNVSPSMTYDGKIIIADFPVLVYRDVGQLIQVVIKYMFQRAASRRDLSKNPRPTFIMADEAHLLLVEQDHIFQSTARSSRTACVYATQSVSGLLDALGANSEPKVHSLLANLQTRICHQQTDIRTIEYTQQLIGRSRQLVMSGNQDKDANWLSPLFGVDTGQSSGFSEIWEHELQAADINGLARGGPPPNVTEAIVYQGGKAFPNGRTWTKAVIPQEPRRA